uniref:Uncharacterized protein n=1 Tax=Cacopsylla melanoneura TaxID=428564 RepID=A0A8D8R6M2_9HEMI
MFPFPLRAPFKATVPGDCFVIYILWTFLSSDLSDLVLIRTNITISSNQIPRLFVGSIINGQTSFVLLKVSRAGFVLITTMGICNYLPSRLCVLYIDYSLYCIETKSTKLYQEYNGMMKCV